MSLFNRGKNPPSKNPTFDITLADSELSALVTREWVSKYNACPYRKLDNKTQFASPLNSSEHDQLKENIRTIPNIGDFEIISCPRPVFLQLVEKQYKGSSDEQGILNVNGPNVGAIIFQAGLQQEADAESLP